VKELIRSNMFMHLQFQKLIEIHETIWSSVSGVVDGLTPHERRDALSALRGSWRDPNDNETWGLAAKCAGADEFAERVSCWSK
jgi:hypothetical protein